MLIVKNSLLNAAGYLIPALLSIPILGYMARKLGVEEFGYLSIIMAIVGYAGIFDIGITRSVIREIAIYKDDDNQVRNILSTSNLIVSLLGIFASIVIIFFTNAIAQYLKVSSVAYNDFIYSMYMVAISIPVFLVTQVYCSLLEGKQEFLKLNAYKTISSSLVVVLPALALFIEKKLLSAVIGLAFSRILSMFIILYFLKDYRISFKFDKVVFKRLLHFGGWIAVSNIISPIMSYFDRFILSNRVGGSLVGYYTAPSEAIGRFGILPSAIARTIFPMLASSEDKIAIKKQAYLIVAILIVPIGIFSIYFSQGILTLWLGKEYSENSSDIFKVLMLGLIVNAFAQVPFASIQAKGLSKITAYIHLAEFLPYLVMLFTAINYFGLIGAAWAWTIRVSVDCVALLWFDEFRSNKH